MWSLFGLTSYTMILQNKTDRQLYDYQTYFEIQPAEGTLGRNSYRSCCFLCSASSCNRRNIFSCFFPPFRERDDTLRANSLCFSSLSLCITHKKETMTGQGETKHNVTLLSEKKTLLLSFNAYLL